MTAITEPNRKIGSIVGRLDPIIILAEIAWNDYMDAVARVESHYSARSTLDDFAAWQMWAIDLAGLQVAAEVKAEEWDKVAKQLAPVRQDSTPGEWKTALELCSAPTNAVDWVIEDPSHYATGAGQGPVRRDVTELVEQQNRLFSRIAQMGVLGSSGVA